MKKEIRFSYLAGYYPTRKSKKIRYREIEDSISLTIPEVKENNFPIIIKCTGNDISFTRIMHGNVLRGYNGRLMRPVKEKLYEYQSCGYLWKEQEEAKKDPYTKDSVNIPDSDINRLIDTRTRMIEKIKNDYSNMVCFEGKLWEATAEPYIKVYDDDDNHNFSLAYYFTDPYDNKLRLSRYEFRLDDWINIYSKQFLSQSNHIDQDFELELSRGYKKYLHLQYSTVSIYDSRYQLALSKIPEITYIYGPLYVIDNSNLYAIQFKIEEFADAIYEFRVNAYSRNEALVKFFETNQSIPYKNILSVEIQEESKL